MGGGELEVKGGAAALLEADFSYNVPQWKPSVTHRLNGSQGELEVTQDTQTSAAGDSENHWQLALNDAMPMDVSAHVGAGEVHLTLGSLNLRSVSLEVGAGNVDVDLRGQPRASYKVSVRGGVGSVTIHVPATVSIAASASGGIGSISVEGLEKQGDRWVNTKVPSGPATIDLDVQGGVGEIRILAE
jgi:predicted membrane protein